MRPTSAGLPSKARKSFSKISTPSKPARAIASSFSGSSPLTDTVAIEVFISGNPPRSGRNGQSQQPSSWHYGECREDFNSIDQIKSLI
jgi:hypothetical protein